MIKKILIICLLCSLYLLCSLRSEIAFSSEQEDYIKQLKVQERIAAREEELQARKDRRIANGIKRGDNRIARVEFNKNYSMYLRMAYMRRLSTPSVVISRPYYPTYPFYENLYLR